MTQQNRIVRGAILLGLSLLGLALVWLFLSGVSTVQATPPIEGNPISMGSASNVTTNPARAVAAADPDQNGRPDLAFGQGSSLQSAGNTCGRVFTDTGVPVSTTELANEYMVIGDLDRDGHPDIVTDKPSPNRMYASENDGTPFNGIWLQHDLGWRGNFVPHALADLDGDGDLDIVAANWCCAPDWRIEIWQNDGSPFIGEWITQTTIGNPPESVTAMAVGDLDGNSTLEIVAGIGGNDTISPTIGIWHFDGDPFATSWISTEVAVVSYTVNSIALGDLNNNGRLDIVFGTDHAPAVGSESDPRPQSEWIDAYQLRAFRNDGAPFTGGWTAFDLGRDPETYSLRIAYHGFFGADIYSVDVADFNNDGYLDIATGEALEGDYQVMVWENDGTPFDGELWQPTTAGFGPFWDNGNGNPWLCARANSVVAADFDCDGWIDLVSGSYNDDDHSCCEINYWENNGQPFGEFVTDTHWISHCVEADASSVDSVEIIGAADFDDDGDMDIASLSHDTIDVRVWQNEVAGCAEDVDVEASPNSILADGSSTSVVTATVTGKCGGMVADGTVVTFTTTLGSFPTDPYTTTTLSGVATATLTSSMTAGTAVVTATVGTASDQITVTFEAGSSPPTTLKVFLPIVMKEFGN